MDANNDYDLRAEKIVIVAGPSFGTALKFVLFGAALGAAAVVVLQRNASFSDAETAEASAAPRAAKSRKDMVQRISKLTARAKVLARQARDLAASTRDSVAPAVGDAILQARATAKANEEKLREDLQRPAESEIRDEQA